MNRRGNALLLILMVIAMGAAAGVVFYARLSNEQLGQRTDERRVQALWLARSALEVGFSGDRRVETPLGPATLHAGAGEVLVELDGGRATVIREPYQERWEPLASR